MRKKEQIEQKLKEFVDNFKLNTPELNNLRAKRDLYTNKIIELFIKNISKQPNKKEQFIFIFNLNKLSEFTAFINKITEDENEDILLKTIKILNNNIEDYKLNIFKNENQILNIIEYAKSNKKKYVKIHDIVKEISIFEQPSKPDNINEKIYQYIEEELSKAKIKFAETITPINITLGGESVPWMRDAFNPFSGAYRQRELPFDNDFFEDFKDILYDAQCRLRNMYPNI